jgi:hypothetical protein
MKTQNRKPKFITFTGADAATDPARMLALQEVYPIEWGILFSPDRQGKDPRYPDLSVVTEFFGRGLNLAAHICGDYSAAIMAWNDPDIPVNLATFNRAQINHRWPNIDAIEIFGARHSLSCIAQWRDGSGFTSASTRNQWLYDCSGGRGVMPDRFPPHPGYLVGYAGGISPDNVEDVIEKINAAGPSSGVYWIDMESKVRNERDEFDLNLVEQVCRNVYGPAPAVNDSSDLVDNGPGKT